MRKRLQRLLENTKSALRTPTLKQKEAYGRMFHTLSCACIIGGVTLVSTDAVTWVDGVAKPLTLFVWGVLLCIAGAIFSKGE